MISLAQDNREGQKNSWEVSSVFRKWIKGRAAAGFHYGNYKIQAFLPCNTPCHPTQNGVP